MSHSLNLSPIIVQLAWVQVRGLFKLVWIHNPQTWGLIRAQCLKMLFQYNDPQTSNIMSDKDETVKKCYYVP